MSYYSFSQGHFVIFLWDSTGNHTDCSIPFFPSLPRRYDPVSSFSLPPAAAISHLLTRSFAPTVVVTSRLPDSSDEFWVVIPLWQHSRSAGGVAGMVVAHQLSPDRVFIYSWIRGTQVFF